MEHGLRYQAGGRSVETRFKPGNVSSNTLPVGAYRVTTDGTLQRKIGNAPGGPHKRWRSVAELVWIEHRGPVPPGHVVRFLPGCRTTDPEQVTPDKLECVSLADNLRRNSVHRYPKEVARLIQLKGAVNRQVNRINRESKESTS